MKKGLAVVGYPIGKGGALSGTANLLTKEGMDKLSGDDKAAAEKLCNSLTEAVA